jgi:hypothetical protein
VEFHKFVHSSKSVAKRGILDSLFICNDEIVKSKQTLDAVHEIVSVPRNGAYRVAKESDMNDGRQMD